jgi:hypothetical protein
MNPLGIDVGDPMHSSTKRGEAYLEGVTDMMADGIWMRMLALSELR